MKKNISIIILSVALAVCLCVCIGQYFELKANGEEYYTVSTFEIISNTGKYNRKTFDTEGYLEFNEERTAIYVLKEFCDEGVYKNGIWIDTDGLSKEILLQLQEFDGQYVWIEGTYYKYSCGPKGAFSGSIGNITNVERAT